METAQLWGLWVLSRHTSLVDTLVQFSIGRVRTMKYKLSLIHEESAGALRRKSFAWAVIFVHLDIHYPCSVLILAAVCNHRVQRMAIATFWRTFHHNRKISPSCWVWGEHAHPLSLYLPSHTKLWWALQLRGQYTLPLFLLHPYM